ncbi:hypothetical protein AKN88_08800 [Thiopseudomonas alkaliphila]|uniref:Uncharacterized protein n=1 Tax=Thiopseudomonas alkaliphila TaxID=1697053 RepID=A0A0K1XF44_9GAMM|nr:hypothetical protein AKN88_08800 [Thiopseudomonas alkaliphila]
MLPAIELNMLCTCKFSIHHRVILANDTRGFVQVIAAGVASAGMSFLDTSFPLIPVAADFLLAAHRLLRK